MWFEIIPAAYIIGASIAFPTIAIVILNKLVFGNVYRRDLTLPLDRRYYLRDTRLSHDAYKQFGLETIEDEDDKPRDDGGGSSGVCKSETRNSAPLNIETNGSKPQIDIKPKESEKEGRHSVTMKPEVPNEEKNKSKVESQMEMKKDIIIGSAGIGGPAATKEPSREEAHEHNTD